MHATCISCCNVVSRELYGQELGNGVAMTNVGGSSNENEWPLIASATHVALGANGHVQNRLVIRANHAGEWLACVETQSADGQITRPAQISVEQANIYSTMLMLVKRFHLPAWLVDRCLLSLRDSVTAEHVSYPPIVAK